MLELNKFKWQLITAIFFINTLYLISEENDKKFEYFFKKLYQEKIEAINNPVLGVEFLNPHISYDGKELPKNLGIQMFYGFFREVSEYYYEDFVYHSHEFAFGGNITTKLNPESNSAQIFDNWRFGLGWQNGYAYNFENFKLYLIHRGTFNWNKITLNYIPENNNLRRIQNDLRFGNSFSSGLMLQVYKPIHIGLFYEKSLVHLRYTFINNMVYWTIENVIQRTPDFFEESLVKRYQNMYPIYYFLYKTSVSLIMYNLRRENINWPLESPEALVIHSFKVDFRFIF